MGAYVKLLEYDNIDGMILLSELSRRRIRSIQKLIRVGRNEVVVVLRVDKEKGMSLTKTLWFLMASAVVHKPIDCAYDIAKQVISICRNEEYPRKMSSNVKNDTIRANSFTQSCATLRRRPRLQWKRSIRKLAGH